MKDHLLELKISFYLWLVRVSDAIRRTACQRMTDAINQRSPGQVALLEKRKGLA